MRRFSYWRVSAIALLWLATVTIDGHADAGERWRDPETGVDITTYACTEDRSKLCGRIIAIPGGGDQHDVKNPDPALRSRSLVGLEILQGFEPVAPGRWEGGGEFGRRPGRIYVPANGDTLGDHRNRYQVVIDADSLSISIANCRLLGCIGKREWKRVATTSDDTNE